MIDKPLSIMIVENHDAFRETFRFFIEQKHANAVKVECASDMEGAILMARGRNEESLLFCDVNMGIHLGPDIVKRMRANSPHFLFPIYMSSAPEMEEFIRAVEGPRAAFISKIGMEAANAFITTAPTWLPTLQRLFVDDMTGLFNRVGLNDTAVHVLAQAARDKTSTACMFVDADRFKQINDTYGHDIGDLALCAIAESLKRTMRESDVVCRRGGDEFLIVLPQTSASEAVRMAERIMEDMRQVSIPTGKGRSIGLEVSIGIAEISHDELTADHKEDLKILEKRSDDAMYDVKNEKKQKAA